MAVATTCWCSRTRRGVQDTPQHYLGPQCPARPQARPTPCCNPLPGQALAGGQSLFHSCSRRVWPEGSWDPGLQLPTLAEGSGQSDSFPGERGVKAEWYLRTKSRARLESEVCSRLEEAPGPGGEADTAAVRSPATTAGRAQSCVNMASLELGRQGDGGVGREPGPRGRARLVGGVGRSLGSHQGSNTRLYRPPQGGLSWKMPALRHFLRTCSATGAPNTPCPVCPHALPHREPRVQAGDCLEHQREEAPATEAPSATPAPGRPRSPQA